MEKKNLINNRNEKIKYLDLAINYLLNNKYIVSEDLNDVKADYGYIFLLDNGNIEALFKIMISFTKFYFALQKENLILLNLNDEAYNNIIKNIKSMHPCLDNCESNESQEDKNRRINNNNILIKYGIEIKDNLVCYFNQENKPQLKTIEEICERAFLSILLASYAVDIYNKTSKKILEKTYFPIFSDFIDIIGQ